MVDTFIRLPTARQAVLSRMATLPDCERLLPAAACALDTIVSDSCEVRASRQGANSLLSWPCAAALNMTAFTRLVLPGLQEGDAGGAAWAVRGKRDVLKPLPHLMLALSQGCELVAQLRKVGDLTLIARPDCPS